MRSTRFVSLVAVMMLVSGVLAASDRPVTRMVPVPAGAFQRGDGRSVSVAAFALLATEVTWSQFKTVADWAVERGYRFEEGIGQADLPAQNITWYDAAKWCNALSEMTGRKPAYYLDASRTEAYREGRVDLSNEHVDWSADGYRLPTEAEWEYAYRAGTTTNLYWGQYARAAAINHRYAVYHEWGSDEVDGGPQRIGSKQPNAWGLYDMAGNVEEWVFDRYAIDYQDVGADNPRGAVQGPLRVLRGGGFVIDRLFTADTRHPSYPFLVNCDVGFRIASSDPKAQVESLAAIKDLPLAPNDTTPFAEERPLLDVREDTDEAACRRLMPLLDLGHPHLKAVRDAYDQCDYPSALAAFRDFMVSRLKTSRLGMGQGAYVSLAEADSWLRIYQQNRPIRWAGSNADNTNTWSWRPNPQIAKAFAKTGKVEYAQAYYWMLNDSALRAKPTWNRLTVAEKGSKGSPRDVFYTYIGFDAGFPLMWFRDLAWMLQSQPATPAIPLASWPTHCTLHSWTSFQAGFRTTAGLWPTRSGATPWKSSSSVSCCRRSGTRPSFVPRASLVCAMPWVQ